MSQAKSRVMSQGSPATSDAVEPSIDLFTPHALVKTEPEEDARSFDHEVIVERVKSEPEQLLYADHEIKEEMVIGPTEFRRPVLELYHSIATPPVTKTNSLDYETGRLYHCKVELRDAREELQCAECGEWSLTAAELLRHKQMHTGKGNEPVLIQPEKRQTDCYNDSIRQPKLSKDKAHQCGSRVGRFACDICGKNFNQSSDTCEKRFSFKGHLRKLLAAHYAVESLECDAYNKRFDFKNSLISHVNVHGVRRFECNTCDKKFLSNGDLKRHLLIHSTVKPHFECHICGKKLTSKSCLNQHLLIHKAKRFACNICEKRFHRKDGLRLHLMTHRNFVCDICKDRFEYKNSLINHLNVHGVKHECNICSMIFLNNGELKKHLLVHSAVKEFVCDICDKRFNARSSWKAHLNIHSSVKNFQSNEKTYCYNAHCLFF